MRESALQVRLGTSMNNHEKPIEEILAPFLNQDHLSTSIAAEREFYSNAARFKGYGAVCDSFRCLVMDSVLALNGETSVDEATLKRELSGVIFG